MYLIFVYGIILLSIIQMDCKSRKYDVELEARKLYGQDLKSVLERFRRTPEYIEILNDEKEKLQMVVDMNFDSNKLYYSTILEQKVKEIITENSTNPSNLRHKTTPGVSYTKYIGPHRKPIVRQHTHNMSGVERLEQYWRLYPDLSLDMRNRMADLGFEYCGYAIHGLITSVLPSENSMSTMQALDSGSKYQSTHYSHKITPTNGDTEDKGQGFPDDTYRNFKSKA
ncbi:unnamed protein product [Pieris macdunnoughi]|uniref:Uncharacterized protein n=2 Tax=Pieris macdunnoughi TaxID=345717 RepID=A0A821VUC8_9NEOP|nr:unnamed protein product [Pieris macdunnoughi]